MKELVAALCVTALTLGCGDNQDPAGAAALWQKIHDENYRGFARAPGYETRRASNAPHSDQVDIYVNSVMAAAVDGPALTSWPVDSLIVKDGFTDDGELDLVAVMEKRSDGWYWAEYQEDGEADYSGKPQLCLDCHGGGSDFVNSFPFPK